jgi:Flp pilus assembly protein TadG
MAVTDRIRVKLVVSAAFWARARAGAGSRAPIGPRGGQALVEFALLLPVFVLMAMVAVDFGQVFYTYEGMANAAREGARYCALKLGTQWPAVDELGSLNGDISGVTPTVAQPQTCPSATMGNPVTVTIQATYTPSTPLVTAAISSWRTANGCTTNCGSLPLSASATMMMTK